MTILASKRLGQYHRLQPYLKVVIFVLKEGGGDSAVLSQHMVKHTNLI